MLKRPVEQFLSPDPTLGRRNGLDLPSLLNSAEDAPPGAAVEVVAQRLLESIGATEVVFLIADLSGERLVPITRVGATQSDTAGEDGATVPTFDSYAGIAMRRQRTQVISDDQGGARLYVPVTARGEAIGVLDLRLAQSPSPVVVKEVNATAHALAYIVVTNRRYTDLFEWGQRLGPISLAAEIQRRLIPGSHTCEAGWFTVAGWLEPSVQVAGDTFDYSFDESSLTLSMTDAMGHSINSALLATTAVAALRNARQASHDLSLRADIANGALFEHSSSEQFVTGLLIDIPLNGSCATFINAGHPAPILVRNGEANVVPVTTDLPFGMFAGSRYRLQALDLEVGDRLILLTDGLLERNVEQFDIMEAIVNLRELHPREVVRQLCAEVTAASGGQLQDDATVLCFDWHSAPGHPRHSSSGSDDSGASA